jgi:hypothetical protein
MMISGKGFSRKQSWPNLRYCAGIQLQGLRKTMKTSISISSHQGQDLNLGPPKYEARVLTTSLLCSVTWCRVITSTMDNHF